MAFTSIFRGILTTIIISSHYETIVEFLTGYKPQIEAVFLGKSFLVRERARRASMRIYTFARFSQGKHTFPTSAISSLPSDQDKYPRDGPFRRPSSRDKTNFSILTSPWESREPDGNFGGWSGLTINPDDLYCVHERITAVVNILKYLQYIM